MLRFLFQGDSITDAGRIRDRNDNFGFGYPNLIASDFLKNRKGQFEFINRGVSGDRVVDLYARIKKDIINLKPDYMSILIGVNDVWHEFSEKNGVSAERYEKVYNMLIEDIFAKLPDVKIFILEPFVLKGTGTEENWDRFRPEVELRAEAAKRVAQKHGLIFVPLQEKLDSAVENGDTEYWLSDGVHPTAAGHELIKEALVEAIDRA